MDGRYRYGPCSDGQLTHCDALDERDLLRRFVEWWREGTYSCTGRCFDIGLTTEEALMRWQEMQDPHSGSTDTGSAGNGSLMRLSPVAIRFWSDRARLADAAARQGKTTHAAAEVVDACVAFADMLADAIEGRSKIEARRSLARVPHRRVHAVELRQDRK